MSIRLVWTHLGKLRIFKRNVSHAPGHGFGYTQLPLGWKIETGRAGNCEAIIEISSVGRSGGRRVERRVDGD